MFRGPYDSPANVCSPGHNDGCYKYIWMSDYFDFNQDDVDHPPYPPKVSYEQILNRVEIDLDTDGGPASPRKVNERQPAQLDDLRTRGLWLDRLHQ
jgi:hypothetical protein